MSGPERQQVAVAIGVILLSLLALYLTGIPEGPRTPRRESTIEPRR